MHSATPDPASKSNLRFGDYHLENVYLRVTESLRAEILELWTTEGAGLRGADAERSSREAVFLVRDRLGVLAGVSTVALVRLKNGQRYYSYSMFLRPRDRVPFLMVVVCDATRDFLRTFKHPVSQPAGMLNINENLKLMRPGMRRLFERHGYRYWGKTARGEDVWVTEFSQAGPPELDPAAVPSSAAGNEG